MDLPGKPPLRDSALTPADVAATPSPVVPEPAGIMPSIMPSLAQLVTHADLETLSPIIAGTVADCDSLVKEITDRLNNAAIACAAECADSIDQCCACITSKAGITAEQAVSVLQKCQGKISKAVSTSYDATIGAVLSVGCVFPSSDIVNSIAAGVVPSIAYQSAAVAYNQAPGMVAGNASLPDTTVQVSAASQPISLPDGSTLPGVSLATHNVVPITGVGGVAQTVAALPTVPASECPAGYTDPRICGKFTICKPIDPNQTLWAVKLPSGGWVMTTDPISVCQGGLQVNPGGVGVGGTISGPSASPPVNANPIPSAPLTFNLKPPPSGGTGTGGGTGGGSGGSPPPTVPPPSVPPPLLPPPGPPTLIDGVCCYEPRPAQLISCGEVAITPPAPQVWITCEPECGSSKIRYCLFIGDTPPTVTKGTILRGPFPDVATAQSACSMPVTICGTGTGSGAGSSGTGSGAAGSGSTGGPGTGTGSQGTDSGSGTGQGSGTGSGLGGPPACSVGNNGPLCTPAGLLAACNEQEQSVNALGAAATTAPIFAISCDSFPTGTGWICETINAILQPFDSFVKQLFAQLPCFSNDYLNSVGEAVINRLVNHWTGVIPDAVTASNTYRQNLGCQYRLPATSDFNGLYVRGFIDYNQWRAGVAVNGDCVAFQELIKDAEFTYPGIPESLSLYRRGYIDRTTLSQYLRLSGVKDDRWEDQFLNLTNYIPAVEESIVWDQRGTTIPNVVDGLSLNDGFEEWWDAGGSAIADAVGMSHDIAQLRYRQTWNIPSIETALEAFRRIKQPFTVPGTGAVAQPVSSGELESVLSAHGMADGWAARSAALTYVPIGLRHLRLGYVTGILSRDELASRFESLGFSPDDAQIQADAFTTSARSDRAKFQGLPTQAEVLSLYREDAIDSATAAGMLGDIGLSVDSITKLLQTADTLRAAAWRKKTVAAIKRRFMIGDYSSNEANNKLLAAGIDPARVTDVIRNFQSELDLKVKEISVMNLCDWFTRGMIDSETYVRRLTNMGYRVEDAQRIQVSCQAKLADKQLSQLDKALKAARKQEAKAAAASRPCKDRPKPYCGVDMKFVRSHKVDRTGKKGPKTTETDTVTETSQADGVTLIQKEEIIS